MKLHSEVSTDEDEKHQILSPNLHQVIKKKKKKKGREKKSNGGQLLCSAEGGRIKDCAKMRRE